MQDTAMEVEVSLSEAAKRLSMSWNRAWARLLAGKLEGRKDSSGRWLVTTQSVAKLRKEIELDRPAA